MPVLFRLVRPHPGGDEPAARVGDRFKTLYFRSGPLPFRGNLVDDVDAFGPPQGQGGIGGIVLLNDVR